MLVWKPEDVLTVLEVASHDNDGSCYHYHVQQSDAFLSLSVMPYESEVTIELVNSIEEDVIFSMHIQDCPSIRRQFDATGEYLEIIAFNFVANLHDQENLPSGVRIYIHPYIKIMMF